jgi:hypothetical protein
MLPHLHGPDKAPAAQRHDPSEPPESRDPMSATGPTFALQELPHLPSAVGFARLLMKAAHPRDEGLIGSLAWTDGTVLPGIEATPTDL